MMTADSSRITIPEFDAMALPDSCEWELVDGTIFSLPFPARIHGDVQHRLAAAFERSFGSAAVVRIEYPYSLGQHTKRRADVAVVSPARHAACPDHLIGAPDIVVEVISRSHLLYSIDDLETKCLSEGARQFWRVNLHERTVAVGVLNDVRTHGAVYGENGVVPVKLFAAEGSLAVSEIVGFDK
jgi:Uma2 family endonuclease